MKTPPPEATKTVYPILRQIVNLIPPNIFHAAASATKDLSRVFTPWSHAVALIYQQLTKTESLNGVCDAARVHASQWQELRGAVPPRRNTFSNANQHRDPAMMESLYWAMKDYLGGLCPEFVKIKNPSVLTRFRERHIHLLDSSTRPSPNPCICRGFCLLRCLRWDSISSESGDFGHSVVTF